MFHAALDEPLVVGEPRPIILLVADASDCARAGGERGEDAHFAARADTPGSMTRQLAVRRAPADRFPKGVLAQGESPTPGAVSTARLSEAVAAAGCGIKLAT